MKKVGMFLLLIAMIAAVTLTACGGGGGGGSSSSDSGGGGGDGGGGGATNIPRYAFAANYNDNSVSSYAVDAATGRLKYIGKVAAGLYPYSVTVDPSGRYVYVANYYQYNVLQFTIGANGSLSHMATPKVATGILPTSITTLGSYQ